MKKRSALIAGIAFILACTPYLTAYASDVMYVGETQGIITRVNRDRVRIEGEVLTDGGFTIVDVNVKNAPVYDLITGQRVSYTEARRGMSARAAYAVDTLPPPYPAVVLWLNACHNDAAVFTAVVSENIRWEAGHCVFLTADGRYRVTLSSETPVYGPRYERMAVGEIMPGQEFFIWVDSITASCPALVYPDKAVLVE
ncbi:MAG: hypothetical protein FWD90_07930 [Defluviitaleaceae bacterium]|nr:hypothetical protein [Defluviitaleaceae bacterium]